MNIIICVKYSKSKVQNRYVYSLARLWEAQVVSGLIVDLKGLDN